MIAVCGSGPHGRELGEIIEDLRHRPVFLDDNADVCPDPIRLLAELNAAWVLGPAWPRIRRMVAERVASLDLRTLPATLVHPDTTVSRTAELGLGVALSPGARIGQRAILGDHVHCGVNAVVSHSNVIGAYSQICPGAMIAGEVVIGNDCFIGIGASIRQGIRIGDGALVAAGATVVMDVGPGMIVKGTPARPM